MVLPPEKQEVILHESERVALNRRRLRAAFLLGEMTEAEYMEALKDDIRLGYRRYAEVFTDDEYRVLTNRAKGVDAFEKPTAEAVRQGDGPGAGQEGQITPEQAARYAADQASLPEDEKPGEEQPPEEHPEEPPPGK